MTQPGDELANGVGGKVAGKVADYLSRATIATRERLAGNTVRVGLALQEEFFRLTGSEVKRTVGPLWAQVADQPDAPEWVRDTFNFVARGHGQWQTLLAGGAMGAAMGTGLLDLITNELTPAIGALISVNPNKRLSPEAIASADVRGLVGRINPVIEAGYGGINEERYELLRELNATVLGPGEVVELYRRKVLSRQVALLYLGRAGMDDSHAKTLLELATSHPSLADAGQMWNRSIVTDDELIALGAINGYSEEDARRYAELGGEPPAPELLYGAFRRGVINTDRLRRGIVQGPIRNEWFDVLEAMQYRSMTPEQAASAITQGHMDQPRGRAIAQEYGLQPDDFDVLIETAGRPPGVEFATEALNRGLIQEAEFDAMFLESAIKNRYLPLLKAMREKLMPQETARSMLAKGVMTVERCTTILKGHGYSDQDVAAFIAAATSEKTAATRDLTAATIRELYAEQEIDRDAADAALQQLGYDAQESAWLLDLTDLARVRTYRNAVITRIRSGFVKGLLDEASAVTTLDSLGVPPARRDTLIQLWTLEQQTVTRDLTPAQIVQAAKKKLMDASTALARLVGQGYAEADATVLLKISGAIT